MRLSVTLLLLILITGCGTPVGRGVQKTLHYATLGLVSNPNVSDGTKLDAINHQADNAASLALEELIRETYEKYHTTALATYILGLSIVVVSFINIPILSFLAKDCWKVGAGIIGGAAGLSVYATLAADAEMVQYLVYIVAALFISGAVFLIYRIIAAIIRERGRVCDIGA